MAEHNIDEPVIGLACDGTGYGTDGEIGAVSVLSQHLIILKDSGTCLIIL